MGKRADKRLAMERAVLDEAMRALAAGGLDALTIAPLAERLGVSVGGLYRYFPGKGAILAGLQRRALAALAAQQDERLAALARRVARARVPARAAALARVLVAFESYLALAATAPVEHRLLDELLSAPEPLYADDEARAVEAALAPLLARGAALLDEAAALGALASGDAELRTAALWAALHGVGHFRKRDRLVPPKLRASRVAEATVDALLLGWGATPKDLAHARQLAGVR